MSRKGKIARLPHAIREEVNQRLLDGQTAGTILAWLNPLPEATKIWEAHFEGMAASPQNLSEWRIGGYRDWVEEREEIEQTKALASYAARQAAAGKNLSEGMQAIYAGKLMQTMEQLVHLGYGEDDDPAASFAKIGGIIATLRNADTAADRVDLDRIKTKQRADALKLDREKFEKQTVEKFMQFAKTKEAQSILNSGAKKSVQMAELRKLIFGERKQ